MDQTLIDSIIQSYRFVWFCGVRGRRTEERLNQMMQRYPEASDAIPNLGAFKDGYGMLVRRDYITTLRGIMSQTFRRSEIKLEYPSSNYNFDSDYWGYPSPNALYSAWFIGLGLCASEVATVFNEYGAMVTACANSTSPSQPSFNVDIFGGRTYSFLVSDYSTLRSNFYPDDEREREHQDAWNLIWLYFNKASFLAPVDSDEAHVLDVGCGSGAWAFNVADTHPGWHVYGYDVSRIIPSDQPPNCELYLDDCNLPVTERDCFDIIHVRGMSVCVDNWSSFIHGCYQALKPGGYLEVQDVLITPHRYRGATPACKRFESLMKMGARQLNRDLLAIKRIRRLMWERGFSDLSKVTKEWPLHTKDYKSKRMADWVRRNFIDGVQGLSHSLMPHSSAQVELCLVDLRKELSKSRTYLKA